MKNWDYSKTWYHGSPLELDTLREGSSITQDKHLAMVFSHKPTVVSREDDGTIRHNGTLPGYLYIIAEAVGPEDVTPHPRTAMYPGAEWLIQRPLAVTLIDTTEPRADESLTAADIARLKQRAG